MPQAVRVHYGVGTGALQVVLITDDLSIMRSRDVRPIGLALASASSHSKQIFCGPGLEGASLGLGFERPGLGLGREGPGLVNIADEAL